MLGGDRCYLRMKDQVGKGEPGHAGEDQLLQRRMAVRGLGTNQTKATRGHLFKSSCCLSLSFPESKAQGLGAGS